MVRSVDKDIDLLWQDFLNGNEASFSIVYYQTVKGLFIYGMQFSADRDLIQDCLQEVFINVYTIKKKVGRRIKSIKSYLFVALRNVILKRLIEDSKLRVAGDRFIHSAVDLNVDCSDESKMINKELKAESQKKLKAAIEGLTPKQKKIIYLRFEEELAYKDISILMNISVESARKSMYRAIIALRKVDNICF